MRYRGLPDQGLLVDGPHIPIQIANVSHIALLDTGARHSYVDEDLLRELGLAPNGMARAIGAVGSELRPTFDVDFTVPGLELTVPKPVRSLGLTRNEHYWIAIVGRDILNDCELTINWHDETISIERLPTVAKTTTGSF